MLYWTRSNRERAPLNRIKLVIFDLDGTVTECGYPTHTRESVLGFVNYDTRRYIVEALPENTRDDVEINRLLAPGV